MPALILPPVGVSAPIITSTADHTIVGETGARGRRETVGLGARIAAWMLTGAVCLAPLPFGSNAPRPIGALGCALALGLICAPIPRRAAQRRMLAALAGLAIAVMMTVALQLCRGPAPDPIWAEAARLLGQLIEPSAAVVRNAPLFAVGNMALCLAAAALGLAVGTDRSHARRLMQAAAWSVVVYALVGIIDAVIDPQGVLWGDREDYAGVALGPFLNRNTAAIYFGCGALLWTARLAKAAAALDWSEQPAASRSIWRSLALPGSGFGLCLGAVVATGSRSGTLLTLAAIATVGLRSLRPFALTASPRLRAALIGVPIVVAVLALAGGVTGMRLHSLGFADEGRFAVYRAVLPIIADHPWRGTGLGTFAAIYPAYRSSIPGMRNVWDKAHSTPLELAAETGLPLASLVVGAALAAFAVLVRGALVRRRDADIPLAAAGCLGLAAVHSCFDFSLQIPGLAVVVMGLTGAGLAQSFNTGRRGAGQGVGASATHPAEGG